MADQIVEQYRHWLLPDEQARHPLYAALCAAVEPDELLVELVAEAPPAQRRPNIVLAAIHDLALADPTGPLAPWYPTAARLDAIGGLDAAPQPIAPPGALPPGGFEAVRAFVEANTDALRAQIEVRATQTNEVGRCGPLLAGIAATGADRIALIDLGCSAGLNLALDRYRYGDEVLGHLGDPTSDVVITPDWRGDARPRFAHAPQIEWRAGIDLAPVDLHEDDEARWLLACQWPDDIPRFERTRLAIRQWRRTPPPAELVAAHLIDELPRLAASAPTECTLVFMHSWVAAYLDHADQRRLAEEIRAIGEERAVAWLSFEHPREVPGLDTPRTRSQRIPGASLLVLEQPPGPPRVLAQSHPHGSWVAWEAQDD